MHRLRIALLALAGVASGQPPQPEAACLVQGVVRNAVSGEPVGKASVVLAPAADRNDWTGSFAAVSEANGTFEIAGVRPGRYRLRVTRRGFVDFDHRTELDLEKTAALKGLDLRLTPQAVVTGRVLDAEGEPVERAQLQLLVERYVGGVKKLVTVRPAYTNDEGTFRIAGLAPGRYFFHAAAMDGAPPSFRPKETALPAYYPGAASSAGAVPVDVAAGADVRLADFVLLTAPSVSIKGRVVVEAPGTQGLPEVQLIRALDHDDSRAATFRVLRARVNDKGEFELHGVSPGVYMAQASIPRGRVWVAGSQIVQVPAGDLEGLVLTIPNPVTITGRIRVEGDAPAELGKPRVQLQPGGPLLPLTAPAESAPARPDLSFELAGLTPKLYGVQAVGLPPGYYTKRVRAGGEDVTSAGVDLRGGAPGPIEITLSPRAAHVSGVAAPGATVALVPKDKDRRQLAALYHHTTASPDGRFAFDNVAPGAYLALAWEDVEPTAWLNAEFLARHEDRAAEITVAEGARTTVELKVIAAGKD